MRINNHGNRRGAIRLLMRVIVSLLLVAGVDGARSAKTAPPAENGQTDVVPEEARAQKQQEPAPAFDPDALPPLTFKIAPDVYFGSKVDAELAWRNNKDLTDQEDDNLLRLDTELSLALLYQPRPFLDFYVEGELSYNNPLVDGEGERTEETELELKRAFMAWRNFAVESLDFSLGRQRIGDDREWLYDENLDAVVLTYKHDRFSANFSVSSLLFEPLVIEGEDSSDDNRNVLNLSSYNAYHYDRKEFIALFALHRRTREDEDSDRTFVGVSWRGRPFKHQKVWLDAATLVGEEDSQDLLGFGVDVGWISEFDDLPWEPSLTLAYAFGSGDSNPDDAVNRNFQQTGLHDNTGKFNGKTKFSYYGEVMDPELSNMMIWTAGLGVIPIKQLSLDLVYHYYRLVERSDELRDASVKEDLTGESRDLGHEVDLIVGLKLTKKIRGSFTAGIFLPGKAFEERDPAAIAKLELRYTF